MKNQGFAPILILLAIFVTITAGGLAVYQNFSTPPASTPTPIKIFLIALDDQGRSGKQVGCNDSLVAVNRGDKITSNQIQTALEELLSIKDQFYGQSGLYNALAASQLKVDNVSLSNGLATVHLSGTYQLEGACDSPRFQSQLEATISQFSSVTSVKIFLNNIPLDQLLGGSSNPPTPLPSLPPNQTTDWQQYQNPRYHYTIKYPKDWSFIKEGYSPPPPTTVMFSPAANQVSFTIFALETDETDLSHYGEIPNLKSQSYQESPVTLAGQTAIRLEPPKSTAGSTYVYSLYKNHAYTLSWGGDSSVTQQYQTIFEQILTSFTLTD